MTSPCIFSYNCMGIYSYLNRASVFLKKAPVACAVFLLDSTGLELPGSPRLPVPPWSNMRQKLPQPCRTWLLLLPKPPLPIGVTNLLSFCFRHPELVVAQEEGPHGLANLRLNAPIVDEAQQLLFLVTLWREVGGGGSKGFGQQKTREWTL